MNHRSRFARALGWTLIGLGACVFVATVAFSFAGFDPKSAGSLVFAAFFLLAVGWIVGDF